MRDRLQWDIDGRDWPNRAWSRFVTAAGLRWHVQVSAEREETVLLVHGTGASSHSWRGLAPLLAAKYRVVSVDLPGHGFTGSLPSGMASLPCIAAKLTALLQSLAIAPQWAVGHSAGAAIIARIALDDALPLRAIASLNGALLPLPGWSGAVFPPVAKFLAANSLAARLFAWRANDPAAVRRLVASTGSSLDRAGLDFYGRLIGSPAHVAGTLQMMAAWDLESLQRDLPQLDTPLLLLVGQQDRTVAPAEADRVRKFVPTARIESLPGLGHLAHEERPELVAEALLRFATATAGSVA
jgi:magnesium chelatase accessory protein